MAIIKLVEHQLSDVTNLKATGLVLAVGSIVFVFVRWLHAILTSPLRHVPGPQLWALTDCIMLWNFVKGRLCFATKDLHDKYGEVVRISPQYVSFNSFEALDEIDGFVRPGKGKNFPKDMRYYQEPASGHVNLLMAADDDHRRLRRVQAHAFSERALGMQEDILQQYVDQYIHSVEMKCKVTGSTTIDATMWNNFFTFDVIGDLGFGEPFHCLENEELNPWILAIANLVELSSYRRVIRAHPWMYYLLRSAAPKGDNSMGRKAHVQYGVEKAMRRLERETDRPDFMTFMLKNNSEKGNIMSEGELKEAAALLVMAGSETTSTGITGIMYHLLKNPVAAKKLSAELRSNFKSLDEISLVSVNKQSYLLACIDEGLRMHPPAPMTGPRKVPEGGATVRGYYLPAGTTVGVTQWASNYSADHFKDPYSFRPERWLGDPVYANDKRESRQPFAWGPRNCLGRNLANAEMRLMVAKLFWAFDLELAEGGDMWPQRCKAYSLWQRAPMPVTVRRRVDH